LPEVANPGMQYGFESFASGRIAENAASELITTETAITRDHVRPKGMTNFIEGGLAGFYELSSEEIGVDDGDPAVGQKRGSGGFPHAHAAGET
jgi:hypothetical protein